MGPGTPARLESYASRARAGRQPAVTDKSHEDSDLLPPNWDRNGAQALPQSNMVVLVDTEAGITGVGQGGSPDTVRNVSRSVIGRNAFDTEMIWQAAFMDAHYSPGDERLHALGAIDLALWDIKGKALKVRSTSSSAARRANTSSCTPRRSPAGDRAARRGQRMGLKERAAATMAAGWRVYRVDSGILPSTGGARAGGPAAGPGAAPGAAGGAPAARAAGGADRCSTLARGFRRSSRRWSRSARALGPTATS